MNIIFFGSDDFAAVHFQSVIDSKHKIVACVTQPDRPKGRGMKVVLSEIKACAKAHNIPILQPGSLKASGIAEELRKFQCNVFVVIAYGQFLPTEILNIPSQGAINVHGSLLPKYRGAAPINWAIINGEKETGVSIIQINEHMDAGDVLAEIKVIISSDDTSRTLRAKMMKKGPSLLLKTLDELAENRCTPAVQDHSQATFAPKLTKELGAIQWTKKADEINNLVRGLLPWPSAYTSYSGKFLKILEAQVVRQDFSQHKPGTVVEISREGIIVAAKSSGLLIKKVHLQDSKPMDVSAFLRGHSVEVGFQFK